MNCCCYTRRAGDGKAVSLWEDLWNGIVNISRIVLTVQHSISTRGDSSLISPASFHTNAVSTEQVQCMFLMLIKLTPGLIFGVMHYSAKKAYYFFMKGNRELLSIETQNLLLATGTKTLNTRGMLRRRTMHLDDYTARSATEYK